MIKMMRIYNIGRYNINKIYNNFIKNHISQQNYKDNTYLSTKIEYYKNKQKDTINISSIQQNQQKNIQKMKEQLYKYAKQQKILKVSLYFKTNKGQYGQNDIFIGVTIPQLRSLVKQYYNYVSIDDITSLLHSQIHQQRLLSLLTLTHKYQKNIPQRQQIYSYYLNQDNIKYINNWDLIDCSCYKILGKYMLNNHQHIDVLYKFAVDKSIWKRRIAIITTYQFIKNDNIEHTIEISRLLLGDKEDLIHKAVGWMLRQVGKKNKDRLKYFLQEYGHQMARTTWRYATQKLNNDQKNHIKDINQIKSQQNK